MPTADFDVFAAKMKAIGVEKCDAEACYTADKCEDIWPDMETLEFTLAGSKFTLEPWQYAWNMPQYCRIGVSALIGSPYILGDAFLRSYITTFDLTNSQVTIGKSVNAPVKTTPPNHFWLYLILCIAASVGLIVVILCCCKEKIKSCCKREDRTQEAGQHYSQVRGSDQN